MLYFSRSSVFPHEQYSVLARFYCIVILSNIILTSHPHRIISVIQFRDLTAPSQILILRFSCPYPTPLRADHLWVGRPWVNDSVSQITINYFYLFTLSTSPEQTCTLQSSFPECHWQNSAHTSNPPYRPYINVQSVIWRIIGPIWPICP